MEKYGKIEVVSMKPVKTISGMLFALAFLAFMAAPAHAVRNYTQAGSDLTLGAFNGTLFNSTGLFVHLNWTDGANTTYVSNGTYVSPVIDAGYSARWLSLLWAWKQRTCPANMSYIDKLGGYCIDQYEASMPSANTSVMGNSTDIANPNSATGKNATSRPGVVPWVSISANTARTACSNAGKYLCRSDQWLGAADLQGAYYNLPATLSAFPYYCVVDSSTYCGGHSYSSGNACNTGDKPGCRSKYNVYDMTGNVYEWINETVTTIKPCSPTGTSGNCYPSDSGWKNANDSTTLKYGNDAVYFIGGTNAGYAVSRGGRWDNGAGAGPFNAYLGLAPADTVSSFGFRCCSSST